jgi:hypothetical protein
MMAAVVTQILIGGGQGIGTRGLRHAFVLATGFISTCPNKPMAVRHRTEQGQALIIGVRRLNFFATIDGAGRGFGTNRRRDQDGGQGTLQDNSQDFIL